MKKVLLVFAVVAASFAAEAQSTSSATSNTGFKFGIGPRVGLPVGTAGDIYSFVAGAELQGEYSFSSNVSGTINAGYSRFFGKTIGGFEVASTGVIPVLAGVRVYPSPTFFIGGRAGLSISTAEGGGSDFTYEPQVGYNARKFQLALGYNGISGDGVTFGHLGLSAIFKL